MDFDQLMERALLEKQKSLSPNGETLAPGTAGPADMPRQTIDELVADLRTSPLFMNELDPDSEQVQALQALAFEGTPLENSLSFKDQGNECFTARRHADAREFYTKGIDLLAPLERKRRKGEKTTHMEPVEGDDEREVEVEDDDDEIAKQRATLEALYVNRAACALELKNHRACWLDCAQALLINPRNVKAYYRSSRALLSVGRLAEADDAAKRGITIDPANKPLQAVARDVATALEAADRKRRATEEREASERKKKATLEAALKARNVRTRSTGAPPEMGDARVRLVPDEEDPRSSLAVPVVLMYPNDMETDFIQAFGEADAIGDHLSYVFPLPWDTKGRYTPAGVECFVETAAGGLVKWGKKLSLLKVLSSGSVEIVDDVLKVFVLPAAEAAAWVTEFKTKKAAVKK
jgi:tetratricopeptide repeat protein 4